MCLGLGGMVDLGSLLGLEPEGEEVTFGGVEVWVMDSHRPWNLGNVFGGFPLEPAVEEGTSLQSRCPPGVVAGRIDRAYKPGKGGIVVFDDGDIEDDLAAEKEAYLALLDMPEIDDDGEDLDDLDDDDDAEDEDLFEEPAHAGQKRKSWSDRDEEDESSDTDDRPHQRRRSNSVSCQASFCFHGH